MARTGWELKEDERGLWVETPDEQKIWIVLPRRGTAAPSGEDRRTARLVEQAPVMFDLLRLDVAIRNGYQAVRALMTELGPLAREAFEMGGMARIGGTPEVV